MEAPNDQPSQPLPPPTTIWLLRLLALAGLAIAGYLLWVDLASRWAQAWTTVPLCSGLSWLDCRSVLNSQWASWLGLPVALPAAAVYGVAVGVLWRISRRRTAEQLQRLWWWLCAAGVVIVGAAGWFIYIQAAHVGRFCSICLIDHAVGLTLALLIWLHGGARCGKGRLGRTRALTAGLLPVAALVIGQWFFGPPYLVPDVPPPGASKWSELPPDADRQGVPLLGGTVVLDPQQHPVLGLRRARHFVVEVMDFACPRCATVSRLVRDARRLYLGDDVAVVVIFSPLNKDCNPHVTGDNPLYRNACELAKIAVAVWLAAPDQYEAFHYWLLENQARMTRQIALAEAERRIGAGPLRRAISDLRAKKLIKYDVTLTQRLKVKTLPGVFAGSYRFESVFPADADVMARTLMDALDHRDEPTQ